MRKIKKIIMNIELNKYTSITYTLKADNSNGRIIESVNVSKPVEFIFGNGSLLPSFENKLKGLKAGDNYEFTIPCKEAYGEFHQERMVELQKTMFADNGVVNDQLLTVGNQVPMQDSQGNRLNGVVKEVKEELVVMDFNHPLAGQDLHFSGQVEAVRQATYDELNPPAHQGCGCGSGDGSCSTDSNHEHHHDHDSCGCNDSGCGC